MNRNFNKKKDNKKDFIKKALNYLKKSLKLESIDITNYFSTIKITRNATLSLV